MGGWVGGWVRHYLEVTKVREDFLPRPIGGEQSHLTCQAL